MRRLSRLLLTVAWLLPAVLCAQQTSWVGHWVNVDRADLQLFIFDLEPDGRVHQLMPAPQFSATYRVERGHLVLRAGDGSVDTSFTLRGDTLMRQGQAAWVRLGAQSQNTIVGTWRPVAAGSMESFMTLRSDGQVILEVGFPVQTNFHADTLRLASTQPSASYTVRQVSDTLYLHDAAGKVHRFVRRPWGCLDAATSDSGAPECR